MQAIYEKARGEAFENLEPPSLAMERVRRYGVAGLFPDAQGDLPFVLYTHIVPRPAWSGKRDFLLEALHQVYEFLTREVTENASGNLRPGRLFNADDERDRVAAEILEGVRLQEAVNNNRGVYG